MIFDHISNASRYELLGPSFKQAFDFLRMNNLELLERGRHDIDGSALFMLVQDNVTKPESEGFWEAHRRYIDLQYLFRGAERIGFGRVPDMRLKSHDEARDLSVLEGEGFYANLEAGCFMVLWPDDAHMPGIAINEPESVRKIVFKIAVSQDWSA